MGYFKTAIFASISEQITKPVTLDKPFTAFWTQQLLILGHPAKYEYTINARCYAYYVLATVQKQHRTNCASQQNN
jgi:hypothetical protein